jgi:hypothetical protein
MYNWNICVTFSRYLTNYLWEIGLCNKVSGKDKKVSLLHKKRTLGATQMFLQNIRCEAAKMQMLNRMSVAKQRYFRCRKIVELPQLGGLLVINRVRSGWAIFRPSWEFRDLWERTNDVRCSFVASSESFLQNKIRAIRLGIRGFYYCFRYGKLNLTRL